MYNIDTCTLRSVCAEILGHAWPQEWDDNASVPTL